LEEFTVNISFHKMMSFEEGFSLLKDYSPFVLWCIGILWITKKGLGVFGSVVGAINRKRML
jgi:hypothetical protein